MVVPTLLPLVETHAPQQQADVSRLVAQAASTQTPVYPVGGGTAIGFGLRPTRPGWGLDLGALDKVVDYPARDMTITVEAGITWRALMSAMLPERQRLPIDVPQADRATLGGVIATNTSGPRRYGQGTIRDYVIGITAVDGRGVEFHGGGRVVKNVAGYDFCKLLCGSLGTLAVITQVTLKVKPVPEVSAFIAHDVADFEQAEALLAGVVSSRTMPVAVELLAGRCWENDPALGPLAAGAKARVLLGYEGSANEVDWQLGHIRSEWREREFERPQEVDPGFVAGLWNRLTEFPAADQSAAVFKFSVPPSAVARLVERLTADRPDLELQSHAGSGIVLVRLEEFNATDVGNLLVGRWHPSANTLEGHLVVLRGPAADLTRQGIWGSTRGDSDVMTAVKRQFDPHDILNPGRFIYPST